MTAIARLTTLFLWPLCPPALAQVDLGANPHAHLWMRNLYQAADGAPLSVTIQQIPNRQDASFFVPGNANYRTETAGPVLFNLSLFRGAAALTGETVPHAIVRELFSRPRDRMFNQNPGTRTGTTLVIEIAKTGGYLSFDGETGTLQEEAGGPVRALLCETPWGIPGI